MQDVEFDESQYVLGVEPPRFACPLDHTYKKMNQWLVRRPKRITALLCLVDEMIPAVIRALIDAGLQIPADMSLVSFGNTSVSCYANPAVDSIDPHMELHMKYGMNMIAQALNGRHPQETGNMLIQIEPELVLRQSVASLVEVS